jgi:hypothetical protein
MNRNFSVAIMTSGAALLLLAACGEGKQQKKPAGANTIDASLVNNPHSASGSTSTTGMATMDFVDTSYDFGKMHEGEAASHEFGFKNNGTAPLLIANAAGSCGCTVPDYPHEPIAPGQSGVISVKFNSAGKVGAQNKSVNIFTNSTKGKHMLHITADVIEVKQ